MVYSVLLGCRRSCSPNILVYICECIYVPYICYLFAPSSVEGTAHLHARFFVFFSFRILHYSPFRLAEPEHTFMPWWYFQNKRYSTPQKSIIYAPDTFSLSAACLKHFEFSFEAGHVYIYMYTNMYIFTCIYIYMYACLCVCVYCMYVYMPEAFRFQLRGRRWPPRLQSKSKAQSKA